LPQEAWVICGNRSRGYATLTQEQKDKLADGPDLQDFVQGTTETEDTKPISPNIVRKKGER